MTERRLCSYTCVYAHEEIYEMKFFLIQVFWYEYLGFNEELADSCDDEESFLEEVESQSHTEMGLYLESIERAPCEATARTQRARASGYSSMSEYVDLESASGEIWLSVEVTEVSEAYVRAYEFEMMYV